MEILFFLIAFISEIVGTIAGFGSSTIFLPLAILFVDFKTALVLVALFHVFGNLGRVGFFRRGLRNYILVYFGIPSVLFAAAGAVLVPYVSQALLKGVLGVFLVVYAVLALANGRVRIRSGKEEHIIGGSLSGFITGLVGTGGALRGAFLTGFGLKKDSYIATAAAIAIAVDMTRIPIYVSQGFLPRAFYWYIPVLFAIAIVGSFAGRLIVSRIPQKIFTKFVLIAIGIIGLKFIVQ